MFEYTTSFAPVEYFLFKRSEFDQERLLPYNPNENSIINNPALLALMNNMGVDRWELVNASPMLRGCFDEVTGVSYAITAGYVLFWKRSI